MASDWQFIPRSIMETERRKQTAENWFKKQRTQLADEWAQRQYDQMSRKNQQMDAGDVAMETPVDLPPFPTPTKPSLAEWQAQQVPTPKLGEPMASHRQLPEPIPSHEVAPAYASSPAFGATPFGSSQVSPTMPIDQRVKPKTLAPGEMPPTLAEFNEGVAKPINEQVRPWARENVPGYAGHEAFGQKEAEIADIAFKNIHANITGATQRGRIGQYDPSDPFYEARQLAGAIGREGIGGFAERAGAQDELARQAGTTVPEMIAQIAYDPTNLTPIAPGKFVAVAKALGKLTERAPIATKMAGSAMKESAEALGTGAKRFASKELGERPLVPGVPNNAAFTTAAKRDLETALWNAQARGAGPEEIAAIRAEYTGVPAGQAGGSLWDRARQLATSETGSIGAVEERAPAFYSQLERVLNGAKVNKAPANQWQNIVKGQVTGDEMKWSGVDDLLKTKGNSPVTKQELLDHLKANQVGVQEVVKGEGFPGLSWRQSGKFTTGIDATGKEFDTIEALPNGMYRLQNGMGEGPFRTLDEAKAVMERHASNSYRPDTKFTNYTLPGGENYRELLFTLPDRTREVASEGYRRVRYSTTGVESRDVNATQPQIDAMRARGFDVEDLGPVMRRDDTGNYRASHWSEPNVLAHARFNERTDLDGKRVLFVEEIQSDWHQAGREKGYRVPETDLGAKPLKAIPQDGYWEVTTNDGRFVTNVYNSEAQTADDAVREAQRRLAAEPRRTAAMIDSRVPQAPFAKTEQWSMMVWKRLVRWAAENDFDRIAWTTGKQQAERYDLAKQIDRLYYKNNGDGTFRLEGDLPNGGQHVFGEAIPAEKLDDYVGKEIAQKIANGEGGYSQSSDMNFLKGTDLQVGGEGMKSFYDQMLPSQIGKFAKKWNASVGQTNVNGELVHAMDLTPAMKQSALKEGFALFQPGFADAGMAVDLGGGAIGATLAYDPNASPEENAARMAGGFALGFAGTHGVRKVGGKALLKDETGSIGLPTRPRPTSTNAANQTLLDMYTKGPTRTPADIWQALVKARRALVRNTTDNLVNLAEFQKAASRAAGRPLNADEMLTELKRLNPDKAAEVHLQEGLRPAIQSVGDDLPWLSTYLTHQDNIDVAKAMGAKAGREVLGREPRRTLLEIDLERARKQMTTLQRKWQEAHNANPDNTDQLEKIGRLMVEPQKNLTRLEQRYATWQAGNTNRTRTLAQTAADTAEQERKFSGGLNVAASEQALTDMAAELGPERMARLQQAADQVWAFGRQMLDRKVQSGIIPRSLYDELVNEYPHYVPTRITDYMKDPYSVPVGKSLSVRDTGLKRNTIEGTVREREDPLASLVRNAYDTETLARKNDAFNAFMKLREMSPELQTLIREVPDSFVTTNQQAKVTGFVDGVRKTYLVPKELERVIKMEAGAVIPGLNVVMGIYRSLLTSRNPLFLASNSLLDAATFAIRESSRAGGPQNLPKIMKVLAEAYGDAFKGLGSGTYKGQATADYLKGGGGMFGFFGGSPGQAKQTVETLSKANALDIKSGGDLLRTVRDLTTLRPIEAIGERIELAPRVASKELALQAGANPVKAVINGRSVTLDFAQGGDVAKVINQFVPFFNVGMQAAATPYRAFRENPKAFLATAVGLLGAPVVAAEAWNRSDPQRAKDYDDVPQYMKDQGVVIMLPGEAPLDEQGNRRPQFALIRLREFAPFAIMTREAVRRAVGDEPRDWQDLIGQGVMSVSPIQGTNAADVASALNPIGANTALQLATNKDFFRNRMITTERNDENASALSKGIAGTIGARPSQVEFAARDLTGGVGGMVLAGSDLLAGKQKQGGVSEVPGVGGFAGRFVKGSIGDRLERARSEMLTGESQQLLKAAGIQYAPSPAIREIKGVPLTMEEQTNYQELLNVFNNKIVQYLSKSTTWQALPPDEREKVLRSLTGKARDDLSDWVFQGIPLEQIKERIMKAG